MLNASMSPKVIGTCPVAGRLRRRSANLTTPSDLVTGEGTWTSSSRREQQAFARRGRGVPRRARRPRGLRRHPREHGADRRHAEAPRVHGRSSASGAGSASPGRRSTAARRATASTSTCSTRRSRGRGGPQIGKGVGIIGKTLIRARQREAEAEFLPKILAQRGRVRGRLQRARRRLRRRVDAAQGRRQATATAGGSTARRPGPRRRTSPSGTGSAPAPTPTRRSTTASRCSSCRSTTRASRSTASGRWATSAPTRCSSTTCSCPTTTWSASSTAASSTSPQALDLERFTMFTFSPIAAAPRPAVSTTCAPRRATASRCKDDPVVRQRIAQLVTEAEVARVLGPALRAAVDEAAATPPPTEASEYKLFATELSKRLADASMDIGGPGRAAAGRHRGRADGGPRRVDLPLHRHRHDRRRRVRDPEEHHRPPQARPAEELLMPMAGGPLDGITVLDLSTVGPGGARARGCWPTTAPGSSRSGRRRGGRPRRSCRRSTPTAASRGMQRVELDLKAPAGRDAFLRLAARADVVHRELPARRRRPPRHRLRRACRRSTRAIVYCSTTGYGQDGPHAQWAGHDLNYLAVGRLPRTARAATPTAGRRCPAPRWPTSRRAACTRRSRSSPRSCAGRAPARARTSTSPVADGVLWLMSLYVDEYLATGVEPGPGPRHPHRAATPATTSTAAADGGWLAVGRHRAARSGPTSAGRSGSTQWMRAPDRRRGPGRDPRRPARARSPSGPRRVGGRCSPRRHLRGAGAVDPRGGDRPAVAARGAVVDAVPPERGRFASSARCWRARCAGRPTTCLTRPRR